MAGFGKRAAFAARRDNVRQLNAIEPIEHGELFRVDCCVEAVALVGRAGPDAAKTP